MYLRPSLISLALTLCSLGSLATAQQLPPAHYLVGTLPPDHYLVGTQGWVNNKPAQILNTIQVISPYTGKARMLQVSGLPAGEAPASFIVQSPRSFLVGTKSLDTQSAAGNIYTLTLQSDNRLWMATPLNTSPLGINASDMVISGQDLFVIGSRAFSNSGSDAKILRIALATGRVSVHLLLGNAYMKLKPKGAIGLGSCLVLVGKNLHAFTFDSTPQTAKDDKPQTAEDNEHWVISTARSASATRLPSIPVSRRRISNKVPNGFGTSGAFIDPKNPKQLIVVGRWGEIHWLNAAGKSVRYEAFPGTISNPYNHLGELWRGVALNTNTFAFGLGEHNFASIDERRIANSRTATEPFANDIARAIDPIPAGTTPTELFAIAGMVYLPGPSSYRTIGNGCPDGTNGIPMSYASGAPARGNTNFSFTLHARPKGRTPRTGGFLLISGTSMPAGVPLGNVAPGCRLFVNLNTLGIIAPTASPTTDLKIGPLVLPSRKNVTVYTQWAILAPKANALGWILSDARALRL